MTSFGSSKTLVPRELGYSRVCEHCAPAAHREFYDQADFGRHLRQSHSKKEGGSFVCMYGPNNVCQSLPLEGVSSQDYESHIRRFHTAPTSMPTINTRIFPTCEDDKLFTISSFTQNLSSVLSDPSRSRAEVQTFFTRHWGDTFVPLPDVPKCSNLCTVDVDQFVRYLKSTGKTYKKYAQAKSALRRFASEADSHDTDDLPSIFLSPGFKLSYYETFSSVFVTPSSGKPDPLSVSVSFPRPDPSIRDPTCTNKKPGEFRVYAALQGKLEVMHDVVDSRLANKLVAKKDAFWQIVNSYGSLHQDLAEALIKIRTVRSGLMRASTSICGATNKIIELHEKRERKKKLIAKLMEISYMRDAQSTVQISLSQGDYIRALECIETSKEVLGSELDGVVCFRHLGTQLSELHEVIGRMMREDFASLVQKEFGTKVDDPGQIVHEGELAAVIAGLVKMRKLSFTLVLRNEIEESVKNILRQTVKQRVVNSGVDLAQFDPSLQNLGDSVRRLKFAEWLKVLEDVMSALFAFNLRIQGLQDMIVNIAARIETPNEDSIEGGIPPNTSLVRSTIGSSSDADDSSSIQQSLFASTGSQIIDAGAMLAFEQRTIPQLRHAVGALSKFANQCAQMRICRLIQARTKDTSDFTFTSPSELCTVLSAVRGFHSKCAIRNWTSAPSESLKSGNCAPLHVCTHKITVDFIDRFHKQKRAKIGECLDQEMWRACDVPAVFQTLVDNCIESGHLQVIGEDAAQKGDGDDERAPIGKVVIAGESYIVVGSALVVIRVLAEYCECVRILPSFASDLLSRIVETLKSFNSRSCQLILGAGALQLVGLKTISVRNLALSSRSLQLVMFFIPVVEKTLDTYLPDDQKHLLRHFKQVVSDYNDHINEITGKLVSVIDHNIVQSLEVWKINGNIPSESFSGICHNLLKFHNGMTGIMPDSQIMELFGKVHLQLRDHLKLQLARLKVSPHDSLTWGVVSQDYAFYTTSVQSMASCRTMHFESLNEMVYGK